MARARRPRGLPDVALAATLHDPTGALRVAIGRALPRLSIWYRSLAVTTSPPTSARVRDVLVAARAYAGSPTANLRGPLYRLAIRRALASGAAHVHYVDLDRAVHWLAHGPGELAGALRLARRHPVLLLGRTQKAHRSHHLPLFATEALVNRLMSLRLGLTGRLDLLVPSFVLTREHARTLLARSRAHDSMLYGEWAAVLLAIAPEVAYLECAGLDWETPDRHRRAVRRAGLAAWRRRQETPVEWARRVDMAAEFLDGFERARARLPAPAPVVRRLARRVAR
jgi:hypothetical protein